MQQKKLISTKWSATLTYIVGIVATDGNLSSDGRHIVITSKDRELLDDIRDFLSLSVSIGVKASGSSIDKKYSVLQIGDKNFFLFLESIGIMKNKSKIIKEIRVPEKYFFHFLRGCIDGDGNIDVYTHKESKNKQLRVRLASASPLFLKWISQEIKRHCGDIGGWLYSPKEKSWQVLTYGKKSSIILLKKIYKNKTIFLERKFRLAKEFI